MNPEVNELLDKARRSIKTAEKNFKDGEVDFAGSRAYYAMSLCRIRVNLTQRRRVAKKTIKSWRLSDLALKKSGKK